MDKEFAKIIEVTEFEIGDIICAKQNWEYGLPFFFIVNDSKDIDYSGSGKVYLKIIENKN